MLINGKGVPEDQAEAVQWYRLAAAQGNASAQSRLGLAYRDGHGVPQDKAEAVQWYRLAAAQGNAFAQYNLGRAYDHGDGVPVRFDLQSLYQPAADLTLPRFHVHHTTQPQGWLLHRPAFDNRSTSAIADDYRIPRSSPRCLVEPLPEWRTVSGKSAQLSGF